MCVQLFYPEAINENNVIIVSLVEVPFHDGYRWIAQAQKTLHKKGQAKQNLFITTIFRQVQKKKEKRSERNTLLFEPYNIFLILKT